MCIDPMQRAYTNETQPGIRWVYTLCNDHTPIRQRYMPFNDDTPMRQLFDGYKHNTTLITR